jgi:hypothetical protein
MISSRRADRELLITLVAALSVSQGRLHRDPCGDWIVVGTRGHFLTDGIAAFAYLPFETARRWERAKRVLSFMTPTQDGDTEGVLKLLEMPTADQAAIIRKLLGLRKVTPLTDEQRASLLSRTNFTACKPPVSTGFIASGRVAATYPPETA